MRSGYRTEPDGVEVVYCIGEGSYSSARIIAAFRTAEERLAWLQAEAKRNPPHFTIRYVDPNIRRPRSGPATSTSDFYEINDIPRPYRPPYWYIDTAYGNPGSYENEADAQARLAEILAGDLTDFLPYWTQDVPFWAAGNAKPKKKK